MKIKYYPYIIIPIGTFIPRRFAAVVFLFIIFVRKGSRNNQALIEHEKVHVRQFWKTFCTHPIWYQFSKAYRLRAEVEGYAVQIKVREVLGKKPEFERHAKFIATHYNLDVTIDEAKALLIEEHSKL
jgi:hypothetical protein